MQLIRWVNYPCNAAELFPILAGCREDELIVAATHIKGNTGRIAWAELARRYGYFNFEIGVSTGAGKFEVTFEAASPPIHDLPQYTTS